MRRLPSRFWASVALLLALTACGKDGGSPAAAGPAAPVKENPAGPGVDEPSPNDPRPLPPTPRPRGTLAVKIKSINDMDASDHP